MKETLCWSCRVPGTGGCSWDSKFEPVEGWEAQPTKLRAWEKGGTGTDSFCVKSCPLYQPMDGDRPTDGRSSMISNDAIEMYIFAGLKDREIARQTGLSVSAVKKRRLRFMKKRREQENGN